MIKNFLKIAFDLKLKHCSLQDAQLIKSKFGINTQTII